jgi:hypothetical protein
MNSTPSKKILDAALLYHDQGLSIIPIKRNKQAAIVWGKYQEERATREDIKKWFASGSFNIGLVTGKISGVVVVDFDLKHNRKSTEFPIEPTVCAKTGGGGEHLFYKHPGYKVQSTNGALFGVGIDIKADGGYVVLAPSIHESGNEYEWQIPFSKDELAEMPAWLTDKLNVGKSQPKTDWSQVAKEDVPEGRRNETCTKMIGKLLHDLNPDMWEEMGWPAIQAWNTAHAKPPLPHKELRTIWDSLGKKQLAQKSNEDKDDRKNSTNQALGLILQEKNMELFHDQHNEPYIKLLTKNRVEVWPCKSKKLETLIAMKFWDEYQSALGGEAIKNVLAILQAKACFEGKEYELHNRVAWDKEGNLWYDLTNEEGQAVLISAGKWKVVTAPPTLFKRYNHQKTQMMPLSGGDVRELLNYVNVTNKQHELLLAVFIVSAFIPDIPHVIPIIYGAQGSAKSTLSKLLRKLCDPSQLEVVSLPRFQDMPQTLSHHWFMFFDNVSFISEEMSDLFCKAVTGSGFTKRELYSNDDDVIYSFKRVIGINGINLVAMRPDLLERSILLELERIPEEKRKQEKEVLADFDLALPSILGGIFDALAKAMVIYPTVKLEKLPRMADFAVWGYAIAEALEYGGEAFLEAYKANINTQNEEVLSQDPVGAAVVIFMEDYTRWEGTVTALYKYLNEIAWSKLSIDTLKDPSWPKAANHLSKRINILEVVLSASGIKLQKSKGDAQRLISFEKITPSTNDGTIETMIGSED